MWVIFALLDADPDPDPATQINADPCGSGSGYGSGSETLADSKLKKSKKRVPGKALKLKKNYLGTTFVCLFQNAPVLLRPAPSIASP